MNLRNSSRENTKCWQAGGVARNHTSLPTHTGTMAWKPSDIIRNNKNQETTQQPKCPSVGEWVNNLWFIKTGEFYKALKRKKLLYTKTQISQSDAK